MERNVFSNLRTCLYINTFTVIFNDMKTVLFSLDQYKSYFVSGVKNGIRNPKNTKYF
jgi:hypothetical protein